MEEKTLQEIIRVNIVFYREKSGMNQLQFGLALGYPEDNAQSRVSRYETGNRSPSKQTLQKMAHVLHITVEQLTSRFRNVEPAVLRAGRSVPLISWVQAGHWHEPEDHFRPGEGEGEPVPSSTKDENAFALRVVGNSMEPEFREGDIIIVSPNTEPVTGDFVVAKVGGEVTFKQLHIFLNKLVLKPLNEAYEPIEIGRSDQVEVRIIGKVIEKVKRY
jgi:SOS-response transcriptional repressor LexA